MFYTFNDNIYIYIYVCVCVCVCVCVYLSNFTKFHYFQHDITNCCIYRVVPPDDGQ